MSRKPMRRALWISWERHRRTREIAKFMDLPLIELHSSLPRLLKHPWFLLRTLVSLVWHRPRVLFVQFPSVFLAMECVLLKPILGYRLVLDAHNDVLLPLIFSSSWYFRWTAFIMKRANFTVVTNRFLVPTVEAAGGRALVLPDRVPSITGGEGSKAISTADIVYICSFSKDEPYREVIEAARRLPSGITVAITGDTSRAETSVVKSAPPNVRFTGFLSEPDYLRLLSKARVVVALSLMPHCLLCGAYEAMALEKPLVTTNSPALSAHFSQGTLHTENSSDAVFAHLIRALENESTLASEMASLKRIRAAEWLVQANSLMAATGT